ncbi:MAG: hypothetical protein D6731_19760 [Planctomycetota bacterium]|nr:MAG: hypothetical protein D6731_19760 [Planctomycetota bacterium]
MRRTLPLTCAFLLCALPAARADRLILRDGRALEGRVRDDGDSVVLVRDGGAEARFPKEQVLEVERGPTPAEVLRARWAALAPDDLPGHRALARDCDARRLRALAREVRRRILERWPDDPETRRALGYVRKDGRWLTRAEAMRSLGLVPSRDGRTWITPEEAARRARRARERDQAQAFEALLRRAATVDSADLAPRLAETPDAVAVPVLLRKARSQTLAVRRLALAELGRRRAPEAEEVLARTAVRDPKGAARRAALDALAQLPSQDRARGYFLRSVTRSKNPFCRVRAVEALGRFPPEGEGAVPVLIRALRESTGNFGTASISVTTQRAYIQDFELSSGGTGNVVAEVAKPVVGTSTEGVALEAKVRRWERRTILAVLRRLTGQSFGTDPAPWERWWRKRSRGARAR